MKKPWQSTKPVSAIHNLTPIVPHSSTIAENKYLDAKDDAKTKLNTSTVKLNQASELTRERFQVLEDVSFRIYHPSASLHTSYRAVIVIHEAQKSSKPS